FQGPEPQLLETADLTLGERLEDEIGERRASQELERLCEESRPLFRLLAAGRGDEVLEPGQVEALWIDAQHVAGRLRLQRLGPEQLPQLRDEVLERRCRRLRRPLAP